MQIASVLNRDQRTEIAKTPTLQVNPPTERNTAIAPANWHPVQCRAMFPRGPQSPAGRTFIVRKLTELVNKCGPGGRPNLSDLQDIIALCGGEPPKHE